MVAPPTKPRAASPKPMGDTVKLAKDDEEPFIFGDRGTPPDAMEFPDISEAASKPIPAMGTSLAANAGKRPTVSRPASPDATNQWYGEQPKKKISRPNSRAPSQASSHGPNREEEQLLQSESQTTEQSIASSKHPSRKSSRPPSQVRGRTGYTLLDKKASNAQSRSASVASTKSAKNTIHKMEREKILNEVHHRDLTQKLEDVLEKRRAARDHAKMAKETVAAVTAKAAANMVS